MKFKMNKGPFLRNKRTTTSIMLELFAVLCVIWIASIGFYTRKFNFSAGLRVFGVGVISIVITLIVDVIVISRRITTLPPALIASSRLK